MEESQIQALYRLQSRLLTLKLLPRIGWLQRGLRDTESIAEHSFSVAALALLVGNMYPQLDQGKLLSIALIHDISEALVGDLPASARRLFGAEAKHAAERLALEELVGDLQQASDYVSLWVEYAQGSSPEARLVKALDRLELLAQALAYEQAGSRSLDEFWADGVAENEEFPIVPALAHRLRTERWRLIEGRV
jgi:putative hydrolase of HD superfamily